MDCYKPAKRVKVRMIDRREFDGGSRVGTTFAQPASFEMRVATLG